VLKQKTVNSSHSDTIIQGVSCELSGPRLLVIFYSAKLKFCF